MNQFRVLFIFMSLFFLSPTVFGQEMDPFHKYNPDIQKYEFARSYITSLKYFDNITQRWKNKNPREEFSNNEEAMMQAYVEYLSLDNTDLRIIKNYNIKYLAGQNALIHAVADRLITLCEKLVDINQKEKSL